MRAEAEKSAAAIAKSEASKAEEEAEKERAYVLTVMSQLREAKGGGREGRGGCRRGGQACGARASRRAGCPSNGPSRAGESEVDGRRGAEAEQGRRETGRSLQSGAPEGGDPSGVGQGSDRYSEEVASIWLGKRSAFEIRPKWRWGSPRFALASSAAPTRDRLSDWSTTACRTDTGGRLGKRLQEVFEGRSHLCQLF